MNRTELRFARCARALLMVALLGVGTHASALDSTVPAGLNVVIIDQTERGEKRATLYRHGIAARASNFNKGAHAEALRKALGDDDNPVARLTIPTGCPSAGTHDTCVSVRRIPDVDLPKVIAETKGATLLILWPEAAYFPQEELYLAYLDVDVLKNGKVVPGTFYVGYRDWECNEDCVPAAFEASAKEMAAMIRYMLELGPAAQSRSTPVEWRSKPLVTSLDKWDNTCAGRYGKERVVREYGQRVWLNEPSGRTLTSVAWGGCNIFAAE